MWVWSSSMLSMENITWRGRCVAREWLVKGEGKGSGGKWSANGGGGVMDDQNQLGLHDGIQL